MGRKYRPREGDRHGLSHCPTCRTPKTHLAPYLSAETLEYHHDKHHNAYVTNLNKLLEGTDLASKSLEEIIQAADGGVFNNAAQVWNHSFYWKCMKPGGGGKPSGELWRRPSTQAFGSYEPSRPSSPRRPSPSSAPAGPGWSMTAAPSR